MKKTKCVLSEADTKRAEAVQHLKYLFWLDFRVPEEYAKIYDPNETDEELADFVVDTVMDGGDLSGFNNEDDCKLMEEYHQDFLNLNAEDVFNECCRDYYVDLFHYLQKQNQNFTKELNGMEYGKTPNFKNRRKALLSKIESNTQEQDKLQQKLLQLGPVQKDLETALGNTGK